MIRAQMPEPAYPGQDVPMPPEQPSPGQLPPELPSPLEPTGDPPMM